MYKILTMQQTLQSKNIENISNEQANAEKNAVIWVFEGLINYMGVI